MRRLLVTGSRTWTDHGLIYATLLDLRDYWADPEAVLVHGAARGVDTIAARFWGNWGLLVEPHPADWRRHGKRAGYVRNAEMVALGADRCVAFIRDRSKGATMCADLAERAGIPVRRCEIRA